MLAVDGIFVKLRSDWVATRGHAVSAYADARAAVTGLEAEFAKVASARTTQQVRTAMEKANVHARTFTDTRECTKLTDDDDPKQVNRAMDKVSTRGHSPTPANALGSPIEKCSEGMLGGRRDQRLSL